MIRPLLLIVVGICLLSVSCTKTKRDIALAPEMVTKTDAFFAEMAEIALSFPDGPKEASGRLDPSPGFGIEGEVNTIASSVMQLEFMDSPIGISGDEELRFYYGSNFADALHDRYLSEPAPEGYEEELNAMLDRPYVLAYRVLVFDQPKMVNDETFSGGSATVRFAMYDRKNKTWHSAFEVSGSPPESISFKTADHQMHENVQFHVRDPVRNEILRKAGKILRESTGGQFTF